MVRFTAPDGYPVWVRPGNVEMVYEVRIVRGHNVEAPEHAGTKIVFAGGFQFVREPVEKVLAAIGE